jgi:hypothetical protein
MDAPMELAKIYDKKLGNNANEKALNDFRKKEEVVSGNTPELAESFKKVTEQNPDLEPPTEEPKFDAKKADSAPLPALLEGLSEKELEQFMETKDHIPYLPKNEEIEMPQGYNPLSPEPFAAWKEVTAENPDPVLPEGFSDNPVYLAQEIPTNDLLKELRRSVEPGNEVPGAAVIALPTEDGEDFVANVPGEAVRDALQLKGVDTNAELKKIADEGFVGQREEPVAELPLDEPVEKKPMNAYERLMAEQKAEAEAVQERVAKLKKDAEDRVDEQGRSVPEGWGFIAKNKPNFGQVDRPDNYFNVYGNNNFEASIDADGKITVKDRNGLIPDKSYDNWEDLQADLANQKSEYSSAARERVKEIAKKYGYSDEQIAAFDSMSQQQLADFFANPENHTPAYAEALDDLANASAIDLPNAAQKQRWAEMRANEKILAQAGDAPSEKAPEAEKPVDGLPLTGEILNGKVKYSIGDKKQTNDVTYRILNLKGDTSSLTEKINKLKSRNFIVTGEDGGDLQIQVQRDKKRFPAPGNVKEDIDDILKQLDAPSENAAFVAEYKPTADQIDELQKGLEELDWLNDGIMFIKPEVGRLRADIEIYDDNGMAQDGPFAKIDADGNFEWEDEEAYNKYADRLKEIFDAGLEGINDNQGIQEPQEIDNVPVEQEKLDDNKVEEDKTYVEENPEVIKVNAFVEANAGRLAPIKARDVRRGDFLWNNFNKVYEEILDIQPAAFGRVRFLIKDPRNQKEYFRFFERRSPIRNMRRPGTGEVSEGFKVAPEQNKGDGPKRGRALRRPLEERVEAVAGRAVGGFAYKEGFYKDKNGIALKPGDRIRHGNPKKNEMYGEGVVVVRAGDQVDEAKGVGGIGRKGKVYLDYVWVQMPGESGPRLWKARMIVKQPDNAGPEEGAPDAIADDKFAVPLMEPVVRKDKDKDLEEQIRRAIDAGDEVSFNYNGKTRYVKPVKIWKNPVNDNVNVTAIENGEIKNFTISKMGYIEDPEGAALKRPAPAPAPAAKAPEAPKAAPEMPEDIVKKTVKDLNGGQFELSLIKIGDVYEGAVINKQNGNVQIVVRDKNEQNARVDLARAGDYIQQAAAGDEAMNDGVIPNLDKVNEATAVELIDARSPGVDAMTYENLVAEIKKMRLMLPKARADVANWEEDKLKSAGKQLDKFMRGLKNKNVEGEDFLKTSTYELRQAIAHLNRSKEPLAIEMSEKLTKIYQDFKAKMDAEQIALDAERAKKAAEPLPEGIWPDADAVTSENLAALFAELEVRMLDGGDYNSRDAKKALLTLIEQLKKGTDPQGLDSEKLQKLYSGLSKSTDAKHVEWAQNLKPIIEKLVEDKRKREAKNRQANIDFIDPIAKAEERISAGENIVDAPNIKEVFAKDDVFAANPFLEPFKEELQKFFAPAQAQPLAKLSSKARQALNQYLSGALRDDKALVGATPDQTDKNIREVANLILALRAEELAFSPNRDNVGVAQGLKNIDPDKIFKYGRAKASSSFVPLIIDGVDTGFLVKLNENGVNARNGNNFWLIDTKTGQKLIIKRETLPGRANAEVWAAKLLNVFGVRGVSHVERHPQDDDIIFVTFAGDNLDLVDTPNVYDKVRSKLRLDAKSTAARAKVADLIGMMIFDGVASNTDRHEENFLAAETPENGVAKNGNEDLQLLPIDHGYAHRLSRNRGGIYDPETLLRTNGFYTSRDIYKEIVRSIGGRATHHLIDLTVQQAIQELKRDNGGIEPAVLNDIISQLEVLRGIAPQKWAKDMGARE